MLLYEREKENTPVEAENQERKLIYIQFRNYARKLETLAFNFLSLAYQHLSDQQQVFISRYVKRNIKNCICVVKYWSK